MTKKRTSTMQLEPLQFAFKVNEGGGVILDNNALDIEIECPSCQNTMVLFLNHLITAVTTANFVSIPNNNNRILV